MKPILCRESDLGTRIAHPNDAMRIMLPMMETDVETLVVTCLDAHRRVLTAYVAAVGTATAVECEPRSVFAPALVIGASHIMIAHNHPNGNPTPSQADLDTTRLLEACARILGIGFVDHLVLTRRGAYTSIAEYNENGIIHHT